MLGDRRPGNEASFAYCKRLKPGAQDGLGMRTLLQFGWFSLKWPEQGLHMQVMTHESQKV